MRRAVALLAASMALAAPAAAGGAPAAYKKCVNCHGEPGDGGTMTAPDLAESGYTFEQFESQVTKGSSWEGKPPKKWKYRWKKMPPQIGLGAAETRSLFDYIESVK